MVPSTVAAAVLTASHNVDSGTAAAVEAAARNDAIAERGSVDPVLGVTADRVAR